VSAEFADRVVLVTGSTSGIGEQIARRFHRLGASVVVNSSGTSEASLSAGARMVAELGGDTIYVPGDIADQAQASALIEATIAAHGRLDILVNNAGWTTRVDHRDLDALTDEIMHKTVDVNLLGTWWVTKAAIPHLQASEDPNIVTITSVAGLRPVGSSMAYAMVKAALNHMTLLLAKSYAPIRVNAVAPGLVETPWTSEWGDLHAAMKARNPIRRSATPDDVAEATLALVRNRYTTGEIFVVDGGFTQIF
jgi:ketoreductase RED2